MTEEETAIRLAEHGKEIGSLKHRMNDCEEQQKTICKLVSAVDKPALNMEHMLKEQQEQGGRLLKLEQEPGDNYRYFKRQVAGCVITAIIGLIVGALFALIIK